ncbi:glutamate--cysteine ligase [Cellulomonas marina]|uniref:Putative glutamate--cysteine ligase 2 n=1 Tax=Cellulomonas marina TaxID=988821 RepID=A0A1I0ZVL7_9CELL|nr:glutamate--cysteine ligase [Cellulomonas marina]GIG29396.1 putative glutamate--cysteine ligase 2 [Cellulomonas marina]SFB29814.1 carboxylate-amine ligase [Cellulomonas marina]
MLPTTRRRAATATPLLRPGTAPTAPASPSPLVADALALAAFGAAPVAAPTGLRTMGVEEELLLVDPRTGRPVPRAPQALAAAALLAASTSGTDAGSGTPVVAPPLGAELQQEQVETATPPRTSPDDLLDDLRRLRAAADEAARAVGARAAALACSPLPVVPTRAPGDRYDAIARAFGITCSEQLTSGCHVHVAVASPHEGVAVLDRIRPWLPVLLALSANSPYRDGQDTGYASYRTQAWVRWPGAGPTDLFGSPERYRAEVAALLATGVPLDEGMVYFDARLSARYPTVEVRVADVCLDPADVALLAVLCRALVETAAAEWRAGEPAPDVPTTILRMAA